METQDILAAINDYLDVLEYDRGNVDTNIRALELALDRLALAYHFAPDVFEEDEYPDPPVQDYQRLRHLAASRFPAFGFYTLPSIITTATVQVELQIGDALDDVADIAQDLIGVRWCWEHTSQVDALWRFRFGYEAHWGEHLRCLQLYLHATRCFSPD